MDLGSVILGFSGAINSPVGILTEGQNIVQTEVGQGPTYLSIWTSFRPSDRGQFPMVWPDPGRYSPSSSATATPVVKEAEPPGWAAISRVSASSRSRSSQVLSLHLAVLPWSRYRLSQDMAIRSTHFQCRCPTQIIVIIVVKISGQINLMDRTGSCLSDS